jgi:hypothetical protein
LDEEIKLAGRYRSNFYHGFRNWHIKTTWRKIFAHISPYLLKVPTAETVKGILAPALVRDASVGEEEVQNEEIDDQDFQTVGVQLRALGLVKIEYTQTMSSGMNLFWSFTAAGERLMVETRAIRTKKPAAGKSII